MPEPERPVRARLIVRFFDGDDAKANQVRNGMKEKQTIRRNERGEEVVRNRFKGERPAPGGGQ